MDVRLHSKPQRHYAVNGGVRQTSRPGDDELQSLSRDVLECIQFFDETIVSLEESLQEDERSAGQVKAPASSHGPVDRVGGPLAFSHSHKSSVLASHPSAKDQDIIDLVHPEPDLVQQPIFSPTSPAFPRITSGPDSHFEVKPRRDRVDGLPSEYNPPVRSGSYGPADGLSPYHPPGCIPTPALIAQNIAVNKPAAPAHLLASSLLRRQSMESDKHHGAPASASAKLAHLPPNISVVHTNKDQHGPASVNVHDRQAQMLANLAGTPHVLAQENAQHAAPARSISLKDPAPDVSRMEALSKLGLDRSRSLSGGTPAHAGSAALDPLPTSAGTKARVSRTPQSRAQAERGPEMPRTASPGSHDNRTPQPSAAPVSPTLEFNSYGGKSVFVHPSVYSASDSATSPTSPGPVAPPQSPPNAVELNTYGGKSKFMTPGSGAVARNNLPDILSSHIDKSQTSPVRSEPPPIELNPYGGKSRTFNSPPGANRPSEGATKSFKAPAPTPAPKPQRHTIHMGAAKPAPRAQSPEHRRKPASMFRPQGITVQFSGRGPMNDSRREALRKLGLLKDS
ncbi:proline and serine-rich protein 2 [Betta splendens]|uniref:Proline and serine-rich protein 2 n=1 Tax=Betta splendens TaxID=158456 RepID=A0A6P7NEM8_BETSP|nr:proline and serine-rich protein 2 [Betta splendens]